MVNFRSFKLASFLFVLLNLNSLVSTQRVKLRDVDVLSFFKDKFTLGNRVSGIPQLKCIGSNCNIYSPNSVQCYNRGFDGLDVQWECKADLDKRVRFGELKVICEGYDFPNDPYVLAGSCGLEYSIEYLIKGPKHYGEYYHKDLYETSKLSNFLSLAIIVIIILAVYKSCTKNRENDPRHDFNATYAQIINQSDSINPLNEGIYPPPPPPYGFNPTLSYPNEPQPYPPGFKPETNEQTSPFLQQTSVNIENVNTNPNNGWSTFLTGASVDGIDISNICKNSDFSVWQEPIRRAESPPPAYDSDNNNITTATGFATTSRR